MPTKKTTPTVQKSNGLKSTLVHWIPLALITTMLFGTIHVAVHQNYRQTANDPQTQIVEEVSTTLAQGAPAESLNQQPKVDISKNLGTFLMVYDQKGKLVASNAELDGKAPTLPIGVFAYAKQRGQHRFTWMPKDGVRSAVVLAPYSGTSSGYIAVGRSLREIENRENQLFMTIAASWIFTIISSFVAVVILRKIAK